MNIEAVVGVMRLLARRVVSKSWTGKATVSETFQKEWGL